MCGVLHTTEMQLLLCSWIVVVAFCLPGASQSCNRSINLVLAARRDDPKSQRLVRSVQESVNMTNSNVQAGQQRINVTVREVGDGADEVTQEMLSIQLIDKPDILLTTHNFHDFKLMAGIAHSGGFPVWNVRNMIEWGEFNELPRRYGDVAVAPKLSLIQGVSDAKGQVLYDLIAGLGLDKVLELKADGYESAALAAFHVLVRTTKKKIITKQLGVEEDVSDLLKNVLLALDPEERSQVADYPAVADLLFFNPQVIVIESFLGFFLNRLLMAMTGRDEYKMITGKTVVVFLHHPDSVLEWDGITGLVNKSSNVFLLQQLPTGSRSVPGEDINEALAHDSITAIREAIALVEDYNPCDRVETLVRGSVSLSYANQGSKIAESARKLCLHENNTRSGRIRFTSATSICDHYGPEQPPVRYQLLYPDSKGVFANWTSTSNPSLQVKDRNKADRLNRTGIELSYVKELGVKIAVSTPFAYKDSETGEFSGVAIDLLNYISRKGNFSYDLSLTEWNGTSWDELAEDVGQGKSHCGSIKCHIAVGAITVTPKRAQMCNFTRSFFTSGLRILAPIANSKEDPNIWNFFKPFHWTVWLTTAAMILVSSLIVARLDIAKGITDGMWLSVSVIYAMQENSLVRMRNPFGRIYILVFSFVLLVLVSSYTANMVSFLTVRSTDNEITDINGLRRVRVAARKWASDWTALQHAGITNLVAVTTGTSAVEAITRSTTTTSSSTSSSSNDTTGPPVVADVYVADSAHLELLKAQTCHVKVTSSREIFKQQYAFAMLKNYEYSDQINKLITEAIADGSVQDSYHRHTVNKSVHCEDNESSGISESDLSLGVSNLGGVFLIAAAVGVICILCKLVALFFRNRSQQMKVTADPQTLPLHEINDSK